MKNSRGFTLLELLIVVAIIGLLTGIVLMALNESRKKGRDANRASQVQEFLKAAELYYLENGIYPEDGVGDNSYNYMNAGSIDGFLISEGGFISTIPDDPKFTDINEGYQYCSSADRGSYTILVHAESGAGDFCTVSRGPDDPSTYCGDLTFVAPADCKNRF